MELNEISNKFEDQEKLCKIYDKEEKRAKILLKLKDNTGIFLLLEELQSMVDIINDRLLNEIELGETDRRIILNERNCWNWLFEIFNGANESINKINSYKNKYD